MSDEPTSGFAASLYNYLTGQSIVRNFPFPFDIHNRNTIDETNIEYLLYPNPVDDKLNIEFTNDILPNSVILYNLGGVIIEKHKVNSNKISIDLSTYNSGIYIVQLLFPDGKIISDKVIIY